MLFKKIIVILLLLLPFTLLASDYAKEQRWADQVVDSILDGEAIWLDADNRQFLAIFTADENEALNRGVILMHGIGVHPNWDQVIRPLRVELTTLGWTTLSIQMPILANDAEIDEYAPLFPEVIPRIDAAIDYLDSKGIQTIYLVAHSLGSSMASYYLSKVTDTRVKGLVAIGMPGGANNSDMNSVVTLRQFNLPVLDLFGSNDIEQVLVHRDSKREAAFSVANRDFVQIEIEGASHFFDDHDEQLINSVNSWLNR
jgi:pimeloyl-ACP methyl ester carboxylesterase